MNEFIEIWNLFHDGQISAISEEQDKQITMFIHIPYIRRRIPPLGVSFIIKLHGVSSFSFFNFEGKHETTKEALDLCKVEILSTDSEAMPITINTSSGSLTLAFERLECYLDTGDKVEYNTILKASRDYWQEWKQKSSA